MGIGLDTRLGLDRPRLGLVGLGLEEARPSRVVEASLVEARLCQVVEARLGLLG